jgi:hypothetical protein
MEGDTAVLLEKGDESDSEIGAEYYPPKPYRQRRLRWLNIAQWTANWTNHLLLALLLILIFKQSVLLCPPRLVEKVLVRPEEGETVVFLSFPRFSYLFTDRTK